MTTNEILIMLAVLTLGTQICRFLPEFLPQKVLSSPILQKLNKMLPLTIMLLLTLTGITLPSAEGSYTFFLAQLLALLFVILSYRQFRNTLLSVALGILSLNGVLWVLG